MTMIFFEVRIIRAVEKQIAQSQGPITTYQLTSEENHRRPEVLDYYVNIYDDRLRKLAFAPLNFYTQWGQSQYQAYSCNEITTI